MVGCFSFLRPSKPTLPSPSASTGIAFVPSEMDEKTAELPAYSVESGPLEHGYTELEATIDGLSKELRILSLDIHSHPELAMKEYHTHDVLCRFMRDHGFEVTEHAYGMDTAWEATFEHRSSKLRGGKGRTIGFNSCVLIRLSRRMASDEHTQRGRRPSWRRTCLWPQSHCHRRRRFRPCRSRCAEEGASSCLSPRATLVRQTDTSGRVVLLGTPAEEAIGGKIELIKKGAYKPMDVCLVCRSHFLHHITSICHRCPILLREALSA